jgi:hypothetical protein
MSTLFVSACRDCYPRLDKRHASSFLCLGWCRFDEETAHRGTAESANPRGSSPASRACPRRARRRLPWPHAASPAQRARHADLANERALARVRAEARRPPQAALFLVERGRERVRTADRAALRHERAEAGRRLRVLSAKCVARRGRALEVELVVGEDGVREGLVADGSAHLRSL